MYVCTMVSHSTVTMGKKKTWYCFICKHEMRNGNKKKHLNSRKHKLKAEPKGKTWRCILDKDNPLKMKIVRIDVPPKKTKLKQNEEKRCKRS